MTKLKYNVKVEFIVQKGLRLNSKGKGRLALNFIAKITSKYV